MTRLNPIRIRTARVALAALGIVVALSLDLAAQGASEGEAVTRPLWAEIGAQEQPEEPSPPPRGWRFRWDDHPSLLVGRNTRIEFRARFQAHARESEAPLGDTNTVDLARRRVGLHGRIAGVVDFQLEREIGDDDAWRDVYADYRQFTAVRVRAGHFKLPFSLDENTSPTNLDFVFRSRAANQLAGGRDWGVMVHGRPGRSILEYEVGWFNHDGRNARTRNPARVSGDGTMAGRLTLQPFRSVRRSTFRELQAAIAWTRSDVPEGFTGIRGQTSLDATFYPADVWVRGRRHRTGVEARWLPGPFSVKAEYMRVSTERLEQSVENTDLSPLIATGWYLSGTWVVTGARKAAGLDLPRNSILRGGVGNLELAARIESLAFRSGAQGESASASPRAEVIAGNRDRIATVGVNWYPCRGIKVQANAMREVIADAEAAPLPSKPTFWSAALRLQLSI